MPTSASRGTIRSVSFFSVGSVNGVATSLLVLTTSVQSGSEQVIDITYIHPPEVLNHITFTSYECWAFYVFLVKGE